LPFWLEIDQAYDVFGFQGRDWTPLAPADRARSLHRTHAPAAPTGTALRGSGPALVAAERARHAPCTLPRHFVARSVDLGSVHHQAPGSARAAPVSTCSDSPPRPPAGGNPSPTLDVNRGPACASRPSRVRAGVLRAALAVPELRAPGRPARARTLPVRPARRCSAPVDAPEAKERALLRPLQSPPAAHGAL
jgi:hypothetical protein